MSAAKQPIGMGEFNAAVNSPLVQRAELNRKATQQAVFGDTYENPNFQKARAIIDGDYSYSSKDLKVENQGS